jgi:hypothetical protein
VNKLPPAHPGDEQPKFCKLAANLYRRISTNLYYALVKRGRKQFRRLPKTSERALANRRLSDLRKKIANLTLANIRTVTFEALAKS